MENMYLGVGLAIFVCLTAITVFLNVRRQISDLMAAVLLLFTLVSSWATANHDWIRNLDFRLPGLKSLENEVTRLREETIAALLAESEARRQGLTALVSQVNMSSEKFEQERKAMESTLEQSRLLKENWEAKQNELMEFLHATQTLREQMLAVHNATADLALALTKLIYLQLAGGPQAAGEQQNALRRHLLISLDEVVALAIPDPLVREAFVEEVMKSAPAPPQ